MPLKRFWLFSRNIDRIAAEFDLRAVQVSIAKTSSENLENAMKRLKTQIGSVITFDADASEAEAEEEKLDRASLMDLAGMVTKRQS